MRKSFKKSFEFSLSTQNFKSGSKIPFLRVLFWIGIFTPNLLFAKDWFGVSILLSSFITWILCHHLVNQMVKGKWMADITKSSLLLIFLIGNTWYKLNVHGFEWTDVFYFILIGLTFIGVLLLIIEPKIKSYLEKHSEVETEVDTLEEEEKLS